MASYKRVAPGRKPKVDKRPPGDNMAYYAGGSKNFDESTGQYRTPRRMPPVGKTRTPGRKPPTGVGKPFFDPATGLSADGKISDLVLRGSAAKKIANRPRSASGSSSAANRKRNASKAANDFARAARSKRARSSRITPY
jgi:hypothetical protein